MSLRQVSSLTAKSNACKFLRLLVIDIDELASTEEAAMWRDRLFADEVLHPVLSFVSPGNQGVKLFIPYRINPFLSVEESFDNALHTAWEYLEWKYELKVDRPMPTCPEPVFCRTTEKRKSITINIKK